MRRAVTLTPEEAAGALVDQVADLRRENQELRLNITRLANENNYLCDRLFDAEHIISGQREAAHG